MGSAVGQVPEYIEMVDALVQGAHAHAGHRQADAQHRRHPPSGARGQDGRRRRGFAHQHHQFDHGRRSRRDGAGERRSTARARTAACAARRSSRSRCRWSSEIARDPKTRGLPISGIGGITTWRDAAEFIALGAGNVAGVHGGDDLRLQDRRGDDLRPRRVSWPPRAIGASRIFAAAPYPTSPIGNTSISIMSPRPRSIRTCASNADAATSPARTLRIRRSSPTINGERKFVVNEAECVGCNLCVLVCPVENCIKLAHKTEGVDPRTGLDYAQPPRNWTKHPDNPAVKATAE